MPLELPPEFLQLLAASGRGTDGSDDLRRWLESMPIIEQAKGILMARYLIDADTAFGVLRRWSSHHNIKIRTICDRLTSAAARGGSTQAGSTQVGSTQAGSAYGGSSLDGVLRTLEGPPDTAQIDPQTSAQ
ncbi:ANTAR domain-containing protein [Microlunatus endophyticus]